MTETTTPTLEQMREILEETRAVLAALDAKGEPDIAPAAERASRYHSELLRRDIECSECRARSLREPAAPPLAPPWKEGGGFTCRYCGRVRVTGNPFWKCTKNQNGYCAPPPSAPSSPQPSSERLDPLQIVGPAPGTMHPVNQPSSEASAPQTDERAWLEACKGDGRDILIQHADDSWCIAYWGCIRGVYGWKSKLHNSASGGEGDFCRDVVRYASLPADREPREPHAALVKEIDERIEFLEACVEAARGHELDFLRRCKAAILGGQG